MTAPDVVVPAAGVVVCDDAGRVLLVQRSHDPERGRWTVPGGKAEPGESTRDAAARETLEETGLVVEVGVWLWSVRIPAGDGRVFEVHDYEARVTGGELAAADDAADAGWFAADELAALPLTSDLLHYLRRAGVVPPLADA